MKARQLVFATIIYALVLAAVQALGVQSVPGTTGANDALIASMVLSSGTLMLQLGTYALVVLGLNLLPLLVLIASTQASATKLRALRIAPLTYFCIALLCMWAAILAYNKIFFPRSSFGFLLQYERLSILWSLAIVGTIGFLILGIAPTLWRWSRTVKRWLRPVQIRIALGVLFAIGIAPPMYASLSKSPTTSQQPNVIIIGMDSLSPLHLEHGPNTMPYLQARLRNAAVFTNNLTPLARTFPAWTSILTAKYPVHSGARFNLTAFEHVDFQTTLPKLLRAQGYTTIYAQDERKFNNIDESFGFDHVVGPQVGAAEFLLTKLSDQPIVNLALLSPVAEMLFPFIANNRADDVHYSPQDFVDAIADQIPMDHSKPLFLAAHFCLAHFPYTWRNQKTKAETGRRVSSLEGPHLNTLTTLDAQVEYLLETLQQAGRLDNAIIVLLSDHGESLGYADGLWSRFDASADPIDTIKHENHTAIPVASNTLGHGANVLDRTEYHSLLAIQGLGPMATAVTPGARHQLTALVDVMPTVLGALAFDAPAKIDGVDLLAPHGETPPRLIPTETGIRISSFRSLESIDEGAILREAQQYYRVEPETARLSIKQERYTQLVAAKDLAIHTDDWMLALLRNDASPFFSRQAILIHKPTGQWTSGHDAALIGRAPVSQLTKALKHYFGPEVSDFHTTWAFVAEARPVD